MKFISLLAVVACGLACRLNAGDWPAWRGASRDDVSTESGLLQRWPEGGPPGLWTFQAAGMGYSSFAVVADRLFTVGAREGIEQLIAVDTTTGDEIWSADVGPVWKNRWGNGPRSTPAVADGRVVALSGRGQLVCVLVADGAIQWEVSLRDFGGRIPNWGYSESPLIDQGRVIVTPGNDDGALAAFDLKTGELLWQSWDVTQPAHYSSVIVAEHHGERQYIQLGSRSLFGVRPADGELLWEQKWPGKVAVIPTPIYHEGTIYVSSGYGVGSMSIELDADNQVQKQFHNKVMKNQHGGVIRQGKYVYGYSDGRGWVCQNLETGDMVWNEKRVLGKGAIACADGLFYCLEQDTGVCVLVHATPDGWEERGRLTMTPQTEQRAPDGRIWAHPVIAHGRLYLRDQEILCCYDVVDARQTSGAAATRK